MKVASRNLPLKTIDDLRIAIDSVNKSLPGYKDGDDIPY
jgi:hypothetical protein